MLQVLADMIKIFTKEDLTPPLSDKPVFLMAPAIVVTITLMSFW
jgi:NADH-quinone oxidoreductase subunit H